MKSAKIAVALLTAVFLSSVHAVEQIDIEKSMNSGFERFSFEDKTPLGWSVASQSSKYGTLSVTDDAVKGEKAAEVTASGDFLFFSSSTIKVKPGDIFRISFKIKGQGKVNAGFIFYGQKGFIRTVPTDSGFVNADPDNWKQVEGIIKVKKLENGIPQAARICFHCYPGIIKIDALKLEKLLPDEL